MQALASYIMRGRVQAIVSVASLAIFSLKFPPLTILTTAGVALVTLVHGYREGLVNLVVSTVILTVFTGIVLPQPSIDLELILMYWLPALLLAGIVVTRKSMSLAIIVAATINCLLVVSFYFLTEPATYWLELINNEFIPKYKEVGIQFQDGPEIEKLWLFMSTIMTGTKLALILLAQTMSLLLARWWQALLYNPGGFAQEFHQLHFGKVAANIVLVIVVFAITIADEIVLNLFLIVSIFMMFQGLAVIHNLVTKCKLNPSLLVGVYVLMLVSLIYGALGLFFVSLIGLLDNWLNLRFRLCANKAQDELN